MISVLVACSLLSFADPSDLLGEPPMQLDVGAPPPCDGDEDCYPDSPLCDTRSGECVECLGPEHCEEGWTCGPTGYCRDACEVDSDCEGIEGQVLCDPETGFCVECLSHANCQPEEFCHEGGYCRLDSCTPGESSCRDATIVLCLEDGGSTMAVEVCEGTCEMGDGGAECVAGGGGTGETGSGEGSATDGGTSGASGGSGGSGGSGSGSTDEGGGCRSGAPPHSVWAWLVVLGVAIRRRRSR